MEPENHLLSPHPIVDGSETPFDATLRPRSFQDFMGQTALKEKLSIFVSAAKKRHEPLDHTLFHGPPGLGKTSLAHVLSYELGVKMVLTSGPALEKPGDLAAILTSLPPKGILFIDEIHRLSKVVEESLYPALEDGQLDIILGQGPSARVMTLKLSPFTLIGATTRAGLLSSPMMDRFGMSFRLEFYDESDLKNILLRSAKVLQCPIEESGALEISRRSRGTPRIANRLLKRIRDYAEVRGDGRITKPIAEEALSILSVDKAGLDAMDRTLLSTIINKFNGGPVGLQTLAAAVSEDERTLEEVYEPYLIQRGYLQRTSRGRIVTLLGNEHLKKNLSL